MLQSARPEILIERLAHDGNRCAYRCTEKGRAAMESFIRRAGSAPVHLVNRSAIELAANLALDKPASILAVLCTIQMPLPQMWFEFSNEDYPELLDVSGIFNAYDVPRIGIMLTKMSDGGVHIEMVRQIRTKGGQLLYDVNVFGSTFHLNELPQGAATPDEIFSKDRVSVETLAKRVADHHRWVMGSSAQFSAMVDLAERFQAVWGHGPSVKPLDDGEENAFTGEISFMWRMFYKTVIPLLILINTRTARIIDEQAPVQSRSPARAARKPLIEADEEAGSPVEDGVSTDDYQFVEMSLGDGMRFRAPTGAVGPRGGYKIDYSRETWVIGHYKNTRYGTFWWNPYQRNKGNAGAPPPRIIRILTA